ncbi:hypothetical protein X797_003069 [Metarhizium robertsii]|uniref:Uncharacterized protein n=2 Tax=Metarhizium robertsii TaxID=568076 RepID=A0A0B2X9C4_METRA|nr:uncharacterized protein MAA_10989 [Metarhizium robertsii ARSEF 23]EXV03269.1 hypothetical protein X797_003069 [Metarhizium robertsii]KHO11473.1 hypothetical protein MAA_10989 [Metarhizium robertsii ARSEF 23]
MAPPTTIMGTAAESLSQTSIVTMDTRADEDAEMEVEAEADSLGRGPNQLKGFTEGISGHISVRDPEHYGLILRRAKAL